MIGKEKIEAIKYGVDLASLAEARGIRESSDLFKLKRFFDQK